MSEFHPAAVEDEIHLANPQFHVGMVCSPTQGPCDRGHVAWWPTFDAFRALTCGESGSCPLSSGSVGTDPKP